MCFDINNLTICLTKSLIYNHDDNAVVFCWHQHLSSFYGTERYRKRETERKNKHRQLAKLFLCWHLPLAVTKVVWHTWLLTQGKLRYPPVLMTGCRQQLKSTRGLPTGWAEDWGGSGAAFTSVRLWTVLTTWSWRLGQVAVFTRELRWKLQSPTSKSTSLRNIFTIKETISHSWDVNLHACSELASTRGNTLYKFSHRRRHHHHPSIITTTLVIPVSNSAIIILNILLWQK